MTKRLVALFLLVTVCLWTSGVAGATEQVAYDGPAWTFDVPLSALNDALLVLASPLSPLENTAEPLNLVSVQSRRNGENGENLNGGLRKASNTSMKLDADAYAALVMLFNGAEDAGVELYLRQGYRSYEDQAARYETAVSRGETEGVPQAGQTDYQTGLAAMVVGKDWRVKTLTAAEFAQTPEYQWLAANCARYGYVIRYPEFKEDITGAEFEPWHLRYVGTDIANYMSSHDLCLEEFCQEKDAAQEEFISRGGDVNAAISAEELPDGPVILLEEGPDGDREITIFHD